MINAENSLEWNEILEDNIGKNTIKFHSIIGFLLNLIVPSILLLFFKVNIATYFICFVIFDILQVLLEYIILFIYKNIKLFSWLIQKSKYENEIKKISPLDIEKLKNNLDSSQLFYNEKLEILNKKIKEFENFNDVVTPSSKKNEIIYVEEMILKFKNYKGIVWIEEYMNNIVQISERLISLVKNDEESIVIIINTYNTFSNELLRIISAYEQMSKDQKDKYKPKIKNLLNDFYNHLSGLENKIISFNERSIDFDIEFLQKKIKEENEKNV